MYPDGNQTTPQSRSGQKGAGKLVPLLAALYRRQQQQWQEFAQTCAALALADRRVLDVAGHAVVVQHNPRRLGNITANPSAVSSTCFLCAEYLPAAQIKVPIADELLLLCNPRPIFAEHFTVAHREHTPQTIVPHLQTFLLLGFEMSPHYCLFFNGAQSGASIPNHLHFQAIPAVCLPLSTAKFNPLGRWEGIAIAQLDDPWRQGLRIEGNDFEMLAAAITRMLEVAKRQRGSINGGADAPPIDAGFNISVTGGPGGILRVVLFFRSQPRPSCFYAAEPARMLISPGSVEMGGCIVTARAEDFQRLTSENIKKIYREVCISPADMREVLAVFLR